MQPIYFDHNATTPLSPVAADAMQAAIAADYANPASQHTAGRRARQALEDARERIGRLLGASVDTHQNDQIVFTSGGTEANNLALLGLGDATVRRFATTAIEHPSVAAAAELLARQGHVRETLTVDRDGLIDPNQLDALLQSPARLASVIWGNNETGVLQPIEQLAAICRRHGVPLHIDAVQVAGKLAIDLRALDVSAMTISAHKFHGPVGIGALVVRHGTPLAPQHVGGFQQAGLRPGTEPLMLVLGMVAALEECARDRAAAELRMRGLREQFESLLRAGRPDIVVHAATAPRLPHTSNVAFPGLDRQALLVALDLAGVACSTGSACSSGSSEPSSVLVAMGCSEPLLAGSLRFSLGRDTTPAEIAEAARRILTVCNDLQHVSESRKKPSAAR